MDSGAPHAGAPGTDPFDLARLVTAKNDQHTYEQALREIQRDRKTSHWMWFVFPQVAGLGRSATAQHYAVRSLDEAKAFLAHPVLGPRLVDSAAAMAEAPGESATAVLGSIDDQKLQSSMTLFRRAAPDKPVFMKVLDRWFAGGVDAMTDDLLEGREDRQGRRRRR